MILQLWWWKTTPTMVTPSIAHQSPVSTDQQLIYSTRHLLPSSGLNWFPREIDCPKRVAPEPHTIVLWHLIHKFRFIICTSYTNSSCCTFLYSFILWFCFIRLHKLLLCLFLVYSFGDTLLPRVHTASQQAHGKLKIDSVRFYTHKFQQQVIVRGAHL